MFHSPELLESNAAFFPSVPFSVYLGEELVFFTGEKECKKNAPHISHVPLYIDGLRYELYVEDDEFCAAMLVSAIESNVAAEPDEYPCSFAYFYSLFSHAIRHEICSKTQVEPCTLAATYVLPLGNTFFAAFTFLVMLTVTNPLFVPLSFSHSVDFDHITARLTIGKKSPDAILFGEDLFLTKIYKKTVKAAKFIEQVVEDDTSITVSISSPYVITASALLRAPTTDFRLYFPSPKFVSFEATPITKKETKTKTKK